MHIYIDAANVRENPRPNMIGIDEKYGLSPKCSGSINSGAAAVFERYSGAMWKRVSCRSTVSHTGLWSKQTNRRVHQRHQMHQMHQMHPKPKENTSRQCCCGVTEERKNFFELCRMEIVLWRHFKHNNWRPGIACAFNNLKNLTRTTVSYVESTL